MNAIKITFLMLMLSGSALAMRPVKLPSGIKPMGQGPQIGSCTAAQQRAALWGAAKGMQKRGFGTRKIRSIPGSYSGSLVRNPDGSYRVIQEMVPLDANEIWQEEANSLDGVVPPGFPITPGVDDERLKQLQYFKNILQEQKSLYLLQEELNDIPSSGQAKWDNILFAIYKQVADEIKNKNMNTIRKIADNSLVVSEDFNALLNTLFNRKQTLDMRKSTGGEELDVPLFINVVGSLVGGTQKVLNNMLKSSKTESINNISHKDLFEQTLNELQKISDIHLAMSNLYDEFGNKVSRLFRPLEDLADQIKKKGSFSHQDIQELHNNYAKTVKMLTTPTPPSWDYRSKLKQAEPAIARPTSYWDRIFGK